MIHYLLCFTLLSFGGRLSKTDLAVPLTPVHLSKAVGSWMCWNFVLAEGTSSWFLGREHQLELILNKRFYEGFDEKISSNDWLGEMVSTLIPQQCSQN